MYELLPLKKVKVPPTPFATDWQAVIFRNYGTVPAAALAKVLKTSADVIEAEAERLGLEGIVYDPRWKEKGYITIIKNNWYLLDYEGICMLTGMTEAELARTLFDDDFLFAKVGNFKPEIQPPVYAPLTKAQIALTAEQAKIVRENRFADRTPYFDFFKYVPKINKTKGEKEVKTDGLRLVYNYGELFGDNLLTGDFSAYSEEMLKSLSELGINGLWKHIVLYDLVGLPFDESYGKGWQIRLKNLRALCKKLEKYGIKLWLYLNEPRALPLSFFATRPELLGVHDDRVGALCTSAPEVQKFLYDAVKKVVTEVPELGGFFTITASENLTNCYSRIEYDPHTCPRCKDRTRVEICDEINELYASAIRDAKSDVKLIAWTWGWAENIGWSLQDTIEAAEKLSPEVAVMCVSEEALQVHSDEGDISLLDYSISQVGPSARTAEIFKAAKASGHQVVAKMQINNSWECSSVPYIPCFELIWRHLQNLKALEVDGHMLSWSLGGYPSFNLSLVSHSQSGGTLEEWYQTNFDEEWSQVKRASEYFSEAFEKFPFGISLAYCGPQNIGCANPFYEEPTNLNATMVGFPFDDLDVWRGGFKRETFLERFRVLTEIWKKGLAFLDGVAGYNATCVKRIAEATYCVFRSTYLQTKWIMERDFAAAEEEYTNTRRMLALTAQDATLGFEACNHYMYNENTLLEKLLSLRKLLAKNQKK